MNNLVEKLFEENESTQMARSIKLGLCRAMSEAGLTPKQADELISEKYANAFVDLGIKTPAIISAILGGVIGVSSAEARHRIEQTINNEEDPEIRQTKSKINAYKRMITDLKNNQIMRNSDVSQTGSV